MIFEKGEYFNLVDFLSSVDSHHSELSLQFEDENFNKQQAISFISGLGNRTKLISLSVRFNRKCKLEKVIAPSIGNAFVNLVNLSSLTFHFINAKISEIGMSSLGLSFTKLKSLTSLTLDFRQMQKDIGDQVTSRLGAELANLNNLTHLSLNLWINTIGDIGACSLATSLANITNLTSLVLELRTNKIGDAGASTLGTELIKINKLTFLTLDIWNNLIGEIGGSSLGASFAQSKHLKQLTLDIRKDNNDGTSAFVNQLTKSTDITSLTLFIGKQFNLNSTGSQLKKMRRLVILELKK